jgi:hypothetical protein
MLEGGFTDYSPENDEVTFHLVLQGGRLEGQSLWCCLGRATGTHAGLDSDAHTAAAKRVLNSPNR